MAEALRFWLSLVAMDSLRYLLVAGAAFAIFWKWGRERFRDRLIYGVYPQARKLWHDVRWSMSTVLVFSLSGVLTWYGARAGVIRQYDRIAEHGWAWFAFTIGLLIVLQDAYFYWAHRAMHHQRLYRAFHRVHHMSTNPSPWTAYAFSPLEAAVHAAFVPFVWLVVPIHEIAVFVFLLFMIVRNVLGHLGMELYRPGFAKSRLLGWQTTTTHHAMHHKYFTGNYGLYFTFWDNLMKTTHPLYDETFERAASRKRAPVPELVSARPARWLPWQLRLASSQASHEPRASAGQA